MSGEIQGKEKLVVFQEENGLKLLKEVIELEGLNIKADSERSETQNDQDMRKTLLKIDGAIRCTIVKRLNRFVAKVIVNREIAKAYVNNTGS